MKAALTSFIKTATAKELALLGADVDEDEGDELTTFGLEFVLGFVGPAVAFFKLNSKDEEQADK